MAKSWRCRVRLHRWQRIRGADGQWYRECRDCGTELIDRYKEGPRPPRLADPAILESLLATPPHWWRSDCPGTLAGMAVSLQHVVVDAHDLSALARFWAQVLGWRIVSEHEQR